MFSNGELRGLFGDKLPIEAVNVLLDPNNIGRDKAAMIELVEKSIKDSKVNWSEFVKSPYIKEALEFATQFNWVEDDHEHKSFVIDQMVRLLLGYKLDDGALYDRFVNSFNEQWEGTDVIWQCGEEA